MVIWQWRIVPFTDAHTDAYQHLESPFFHLDASDYYADTVTITVPL
jgi:hypothetical protein